MITIIGTCHIFDLNNKLLDILKDKKPEIICIELDEERYEMLMLKNSDPELYDLYRKQLPILPKLFLYLQERIAKSDEIIQGDELLTAVKYAKSNNIKFEFIDKNQNEVYSKIINSISFFEKFLLTIFGLFSLLTNILCTNRRIKKYHHKKIESDYEEMVLSYGKNFPILKKILLDERNEYMANNLIQMAKECKNIIAVIGDLHVSGLSKILESNNIDHENIRLKELIK